MYGGATVVEGSMTQGAGQEPVERTANLRDNSVPPYSHTPAPPAAPHPGHF
ncbi:serine/threonine protein phosphatase, partial [Streptomyces sp. NPDC059744]